MDEDSRTVTGTGRENWKNVVGKKGRRWKTGRKVMRRMRADVLMRHLVEHQVKVIE